MHRLEGNIQYADGELGSAAETLRRPLARAIARGDPQDIANLAVVLAEVLIELEDCSEALETLDPAIEGGARRINTTLLKSIVHSRLGESGTAQTILEEIKHSKTLDTRMMIRTLVLEVEAELAFSEGN
ncbi:MAG: hypothetical protein ACC647_09670 [Anaerolineales bacterium]